MNLSYSILIILVIIIVFAQFAVIRDIVRKLKNIKDIFLDEYSVNNVYLTLDEIGNIHQAEDIMNFPDAFSPRQEMKNTKKIRLIVGNDGGVIDIINLYLIKNKGELSDFEIIKNITERTCDTEIEDVETQLPIPLYLGLMGTILGIIIGIGEIALKGNGFADFVAHPENHMGALMGGVAIAMCASFCGVLLTTISSWISKSARIEMEKRKNAFYSWIQAEFLPVLPNSSTSMLAQLERNLNRFNFTFGENIKNMQSALKQVTSTTSTQLDLMEIIDKLDVTQMAKGNVIVLKELTKSVDKFRMFGVFLDKMSEYTSKLDELSQKLYKLHDNSRVLEKMGTFFEQGEEVFNQRRDEITKSAMHLNDTLQKTFSMLEEQTGIGMSSLQKSFMTTNGEIVSSFEVQQKMMEEYLSKQLSLLQEYCNKQVDLQDSKMIFGKLESKLDLLTDEIKRGNQLGNRRCSQLIDSFEKLSSSINMRLQYKGACNTKQKSGMPNMNGHLKPHRSLYKEIQNKMYTNIRKLFSRKTPNRK